MEMVGLCYQLWISWRCVSLLHSNCIRLCAGQTPLVPSLVEQSAEDLPADEAQLSRSRIF